METTPGTGAAALREEALRECLADFDRIVLTVSGHCMSPQIEAGHRAVVVGRRWRRPRFGEVVLVRLPVGLRLHRLVWSPPVAGRWRTKADGGPLWDPAVDRGDVLGTVVEVEGHLLPSRRPPSPTLSGLRSLAVSLRFRLRRLARRA